MPENVNEVDVELAPNLLDLFAEIVASHVVASLLAFRDPGSDLPAIEEESVANALEDPLPLFLVLDDLDLCFAPIVGHPRISVEVDFQAQVELHALIFHSKIGRTGQFQSGSNC